MSNNLNQPDDLLTLKQVAAHLQVSTKTVSRLIVRLEIPVARVGNQIRVPSRCLRFFMNTEW